MCHPELVEGSIPLYSKTMNKPVVNEFQPSITEWFALIGKKQDSEAFRAEDNTKNDRLELLNRLIELPTKKPDKLEATDLINKTPVFQKILQERGDEPCAMRLVPKKDNFPKIRSRGLSIRQCYEEWFLKQKINPELYFVNIYPHAHHLLWSSIFVVTKTSILGEIIRGRANQLTQGETENELLTFEYNFINWTWSCHDEQAERIIKATLRDIQVLDKKKQREI